MHDFIDYEYCLFLINSVEVSMACTGANMASGGVVQGPVQTKHEESSDENDCHILCSVQPQEPLHLEVLPTE
jgi:hypothetical protein